MPDFITLTCPSCGGKLQITPDIERFACGNCGNEHLVNRSGGIVTLSPVVNELKKVTRGVDSTASELAITRLNAELKEQEKEKGKITSELNTLYGSLIISILIIIGGIIAFSLECKSIAWILTIAGVVGVIGISYSIKDHTHSIEILNLNITEIEAERDTHLEKVRYKVRNIEGDE